MPMSMPVARASTALLVAFTAAACSSGEQESAPPESSSAGAASSVAAAPESPTTEAASLECATVDAPMLEIPALNPGEPKMAVPAPPGWERTTELDSQLIRFALVNPSLTSDGFAPNVTVTLEAIDGEHSADAVFEAQTTGLVQHGGGTDLKSTPGTLCGQPAETVDYTGAAVGATPSRPITVLLSALTSGGRTYSVSATVQSLDPENPTFQQDRRTILEGFQFLPADAG